MRITEHFQIRKFLTTQLLNFSYKVVRKTLKLQKKSKDRKLNWTGASFKSVYVSIDNPVHSISKNYKFKQS